MIHNHDSFISTLQNKMGKKTYLGAIPERNWSYSPQWNVLKSHSQDMLVDVLREQCKEIHTTFLESSADDVGAVIRKLVEQAGGERIVFPNDQRLANYGVWNTLDNWDGEYWIWDTSKGEENMRFAEQADFGIVVSDQTLAESGTCVLYTDKDIPRSVSLLPQKFIAIIPKKTIVPRLTQATKKVHDKVQKGEQISSCISFVTGPSNSADIEMNLVVGVHGPVGATYILVDG